MTSPTLHNADADDFLAGRTFRPTPEQRDALEAFRTGADLVLEAGAGTGKTSTLQLLAEDADARGLRGRYLAFNRAIVTEAGRKFPGNVACSTAHSLAYRAMQSPDLRRRLDAPRMKSMQTARLLDLDPFVITTAAGRKRLAAGWLAGVTMRAIGRFCQSADEAPGPEHVPYIDGIDLPEQAPDGSWRRGWANNNALRQWLAPAIELAWRDLTDLEHGRLTFGHDVYLKLWQLSHPKASVDFILFDEAQDANPVIAAIVAEQDHAQRVYVGDSQQAIYEFTGAVNAMAEHAGQRSYLTQSFRFGPAIADVANNVLATLDTPLRISGTSTIASEVAPIDQPDAILCRTNAAAMMTVLRELAAGRLPHLVGGGEEVSAFCRAAKELMTEGSTIHRDLSCFDSWREVQEYVGLDPQGGDLRMMVDLIDEHGVDTVLKALDGTVSERQADVVVSTAHKAKGREWDRVRLAGDFKIDEDNPKLPAGDPGERRLLYVAVTRARLELDATAVPWVLQPPTTAPQLAQVIALPTPAAHAGLDCCLHHDQRHGAGVCCLHPSQHTF